jgi:hypothetical protein
MAPNYGDSLRFGQGGGIAGLPHANTQTTGKKENAVHSAVGVATGACRRGSFQNNLQTLLMRTVLKPRELFAASAYT